MVDLGQDGDKDESLREKIRNLIYVDTGYIKKIFSSKLLKMFYVQCAHESL